MQFMIRLLIIMLLVYTAEGQVKSRSTTRRLSEKNSMRSTPAIQGNPKVLEIFKKVEGGIKSGKVEIFDNEFGAMISMNITSGEHGYFSSNQASSIISNYFSNRRTVSFDFSRINDKKPTPYATGRYIYVKTGNQESMQVYISLTLQDTRWVINQFNIY